MRSKKYHCFLELLFAPTSSHEIPRGPISFQEIPLLSRAPYGSQDLSRAPYGSQVLSRAPYGSHLRMMLMVIVNLKLCCQMFEISA